MTARSPGRGLVALILLTGLIAMAGLQAAYLHDATGRHPAIVAGGLALLSAGALAASVWIGYLLGQLTESQRLTALLEQSDEEVEP